MAVPLTGAGSLFVRLGHIFGLADIVLTHVGTTVPAQVEQIDADFASTDQGLSSTLFSNMQSYQATSMTYLATVQALASQVLTQMVQTDTKAQSSSLVDCMTALIAQMRTAVASVAECAVAATVAPVAGNTGNAAIVVSTLDKYGYSAENTLAEVIRAKITNDAQSGGLTAGRELYQLTGMAPVTNGLLTTWPGGSGAYVTGTLIDASLSGGSYGQNWLVNSDFETFTVANTPDDWTIGVGLAGTSVLKSTGTKYTGASSLEFVGDGAESTTIYQEFGTDTTSRPTPLSVLACNLWTKASGTPAAGVMAVELVDGTGTVINDTVGTANRLSIDLTNLGTSFVPKSVFFRLPRVLPAAVRLQVRLSTPLSAGTNVFIDRLALATPVQVYVGGPYVAAFSGSTAAILDDAWTITVTNDRGGDFQTYFDRFFNMRQLGLTLPSAGSPTISDALIT